MYQLNISITESFLTVLIFFLIFNSLDHIVIVYGKVCSFGPRKEREREGDGGNFCFYSNWVCAVSTLLGSFQIFNIKIDPNTRIRQLVQILVYVKMV